MTSKSCNTTSLRICSKALNAKKFGMEYTTGFIPPKAIPAATPTIDCSATPQLVTRSGNFSFNLSRMFSIKSVFPDPIEPRKSME